MSSQYASGGFQLAVARTLAAARQRPDRKAGCSSEAEAQGELNDSRRSRGGELAEARINLFAGSGIEARRSVQAGELGVVKGVVKLGAEL
jgi:hypothetical protein